MVVFTRLIVDAILDEPGARVRAIDLIAPPDRFLAPFPPGSHVGLRWGANRVNFYSLTNDGLDPGRYSLAVAHRADGAGGSSWVHGLVPGEEVFATAPRSAFLPSRRARHHILVSGGIGITPLLGHARWHRDWGASFEAWHVGREDELVRRLRAIAGDRLRVFAHRDDFWDAFAAVVPRAPFGSDVYTCGPAGMIGAVEEYALACGWPAVRIHAEEFTPKAIGGTPFVVDAVASGRAIAVGASQSLLEALEGAELRVPSMCRNGVCGECRTVVVAGAIDHRDDYLSEDERREGTAIMPCVSRAAGERLELAL